MGKIFQRSEEYCKKLSASLKGKKHSEEHKKKIGDALRGEKHYNWKGGQRIPCVSCGKMKWKISNKTPFCIHCVKKNISISEETRMKLRINGGKNKGRRASEETKRKVSLANKGKKRTEEQKKKMSDAQKKACIEGRRKNYKGGIWNNKNYVSWMKQKRNRLLRVSLGKHTFQEWEKLKNNYYLTCPCCLKKEPEIKLTQDHIIPVSLGGSDFIDNIQPLCKSCNSKKWKKVIKYEIKQLNNI